MGAVLGSEFGLNENCSDRRMHSQEYHQSSSKECLETKVNKACADRLTYGERWGLVLKVPKGSSWQDDRYIPATDNLRYYASVCPSTPDVEVWITAVRQRYAIFK